MLRESILRNAVGLGLFAVVTVGVIAVTEYSTRAAIAEERARAERSAMLELLPSASFDNALLDDLVMVEDPALGLDEPAPAYIARQQGRPVAAVVPVRAPDGYSGAIEMIVAIRPNGTLAGVRVLAHRETPGLGDPIEVRKSDWIEGFRGRALGDPGPDGWAVAPDGGVFDAFTGATITPRAVVGAVYRMLQWYEDSGRTLLFGAEAAPGAQLPPRPESEDPA